MSIIGKLVGKLSPTMFVVVSIGGVLTSVALAIDGTIKSTETIKTVKKGQTSGDEVLPDLTKKEIVGLCWKHYIPTIVSSGLTITSILLGNRLHVQRNAALLGAYALVEGKLSRYQKKIVDWVGEKHHTELKDSINKDIVSENVVVKENVEDTHHGNTLCYDALGGRYFWSSIEFIKSAVSKVDMSEDYISLNDVYYMLDLKSSKVGDIIGWEGNRHSSFVRSIELDFSAQLTDKGDPVLVMDFNPDPRHIYEDF